jgi:hypothetical protein
MRGDSDVAVFWDLGATSFESQESDSSVLQKSQIHVQFILPSQAMKL